jgi:hypothetical protein
VTIAAARVDQVADVGLARGHDAVERRGDALERLQCFEPVHVRLGRRDAGLLGGEVAGLFIRVLLRDRILLEHLGPAFGGRRCKLFVRLRIVQIGLGLQQLLVEIGRVDHTEQLSGFHMRADIRIPRMQIAWHPGINWRVNEGRQMARQDERLRGALEARRISGHGRDSLLVGPRGHFLLGMHAGEDASRHDPRGGEQHHDADQLQMT